MRVNFPSEEHTPQLLPPSRASQGPQLPFQPGPPGPRHQRLTVLSPPLANHSFKKIEFQPPEAKKFFSTVRKEMALLATSLPDGIMVKTFEDRMASTPAGAWRGVCRGAAWAPTCRPEWHLRPPQRLQGKKQAWSVGGQDSHRVSGPGGCSFILVLKF